MARKATKKSTRPAQSASPAKKPKKQRASATKATTPARAQPSGGRKKQKPESDMSAADALSGLLESPLVAEVIAAGAAAALATLTQQAISRRAEGGTKEALKQAARAAATAMGTRLAIEIEEIMDSAKKANAEAR